MDVINDRIIDVGLNALGYLFAGGLGVLLHSAMLQRSRRRAAAPEGAAVTEATTTTPKPRKDPDRNIEFVSFDAESPTDAVSSDTGAGSLTNSRHRNRRETIRLAREMLKAGTAGDQIRRTLPISQSELALLKNVSSN